MLCLPSGALTVITVSVPTRCDWPQSPHWHKLFMSLSFPNPRWKTGKAAQTFMSRLVAFFSAAWRGNAARAGCMRLARARTEARM
jgi:hypothetical protein